jgi:excisionase family DNA binding protein
VTALPRSRKGRVTISQAAATLGVSKKTLRNLLSEHRADFDRVYGMSRYGRVRLLSATDVKRLDGFLRCWGVARPSTV